MCVRIDESRDDDSLGGVDDARVRSGQRAHLYIGSRKKESAVTNRKSRHYRPRFIDCVYPRVDDNEVGGLPGLRKNQ